MDNEDKQIAGIVYLLNTAIKEMKTLAYDSYNLEKAISHADVSRSYLETFKEKDRD